MDFLHDLFCYAALFITLKYIENIMSTSPPKDLDDKIKDECLEQEQNGKQKRDKSTCEESNNKSSIKSKIKSFSDKPAKLMKPSKDEICTESIETNYKLNLKSSSTVTTSDIIPIYEYSVKPASSTYMLHGYSTNCTSSLGNIPDSVLPWGGQDPPANLTDDYTSDHTSEYAMSSVKSSNVRCSKSSMQVHVSSATTLLYNKTDVTLNGFTDSTELLHDQINRAAENIKQTLYEIEKSSYKRKEPSNYTSSREKANLPSTSKMASSLSKKTDVNLHSIKSASPASDVSSGSVTPHDEKTKGTTHKQFMEMLAQVTMQSYHSHQELNDSLEVAIIDEHVKINQSIHDSSLYSGYTNSDQFSNITGHGMEHLGEDELYGSGPIMIGHKSILEKRYDHSPNGSMIAVLDFDVHDWNDAHDSISAGTSKD